MASEKRITRESILQAAIQTIQSGGAESLTVRNIAKTLGCSTQPLYYEFEDIQHLKDALQDYIRENFLKFHNDSYRAFGQSFLSFATKEKELFRFLCLQHRQPGQDLLDDLNWEMLISLLAKNLEMPLETAREMHRQMQFRCYGLGVMLAIGYQSMNQEQIDQELTDFFRIILRHYKGITSEEELEYWLQRSRNLIY